MSDVYDNQALFTKGLEIEESREIMNFILDDEFDEGLDTQAKTNIEQNNKQSIPNLNFIFSSK